MTAPTAEAMMRAALRAARRGSGRTFPNPPVGAVVFRGDRILGRGFTRPPGGPHAEVVAIERAVRRHGRRALSGASMAVTLEPCCRTGRTGPCTEAILAAGLERIEIGEIDPHADVSGRGVRRLRRAGLHVRVGVLEAQCREQHRGFRSVQKLGRPFVTLKLAATLDGRIATASGESRWITSAPARRFVHALRERTDAVLIGSRTALADDPELTARREGRVVHRPVRVLIDAGLRVPATARLYARPDPERSWVVTRSDAPAGRRHRIERAGARVLAVPGQGGHVSLRAALRRLAREGLTTLLAEGGGELAAALIRVKLVDEIHWLLAPRLLGGDGRAVLGTLGVRRLAATPRLEEARIRRLGPDWHVAARVRQGAAGNRRGAARSHRGGETP